MTSTAAPSRRGQIWATTWRVLLCELAVVVWAVVLISMHLEMGKEFPLNPAWVLMDLSIGAVCGILVIWRHRWPYQLLALFSVLGMVSTSCFLAYMALIMAAGARRRMKPLVLLGILGEVTTFIATVVIQPVTMTAGGSQTRSVVDDISTLGVGLVIFVALAAIGWSRGAKRELHESWRLAAESARREQVARVGQAQQAERARIAREMHDVLAHKISLVSLHAGVLAYKDDLTQAETRDTALIIRETSHQALEELREVLGVLRDDGYQANQPPQPTTLLDLPRLVAQEEAAGAQITLVVPDDFWTQAATLPASTSRHAERIVRECLTNAHKHAPGRPVLVEASGDETNGLHLRVRNELGGRTTTPGSGLGLEGLRERANLAGGTLEFERADTHFEVRATLPWNVRIGS